MDCESADLVGVKTVEGLEKLLADSWERLKGTSAVDCWACVKVDSLENWMEFEMAAQKVSQMDMILVALKDGE